MRKSLLVFLALLTFSAVLFAQYGDEKKIEFTITGGYGIGTLNGTSAYADTWGPAGALDLVNEGTAIALTNKNTFTLGASFSYFITPNFGIQLGGAYFGPKADVTSDWTWDWTTGILSDSKSGSFAVTEAKMTSIPLYLNLVGRYQAANFDLYASGGPTIYFNKFNADANAIYSDTAYFGWAQFIDYFFVPLTIPETSWTGFGFNVGGGFDYKFSPSVAFVVDARYYYCPPYKDAAGDFFKWTWVPGTYSGEPYYYDARSWGLTLFDDWDFSSGYNAYMEARTSTLTFNPSFFTITGGFKFFF